MINQPQLPPKKGYVEIQVNGQRIYQKIKNESEDINATLAEAIAELMVQVALLEMGGTNDSL